MFKGIYEAIFDTVLDNKHLSNSTMLLIGADLKQEEKQEIMDYIALRCLSEYSKDAKFIISDTKQKSDSIIKYGYDPNFIPCAFKPENTVFITDVFLPYFDTVDNWETKMLTALSYYKFSVYGFASRQIIKIYNQDGGIL